MSSPGLSDLRKLSNIISDSVDRIEKVLASSSLDFPSLVSLYSEKQEAARNLPGVAKSVVALIAASEQLAMTARSPSASLLDMSKKFQLCGALRIALEADVAEVLREKGPSHVDYIAKQRNIDPSKLARALRMLATHHVFTEVTPNIFANNRVSSIMDSGRPCSQLAADPSAKLVGLPAQLSFTLDFSFKRGGYLADVVLSPATSHSTSPCDTAWSGADGINGAFFECLDRPGNERLRETFGAAMLGITALTHPTAILEAGSVVVDVGGGIGTQMLILARHFRHLKLVVEDRAAVCPDTLKYLTYEAPYILATGQIQIIGHDFFNPQPVKDASVFYVRHICHDWPDAEAVKILRNLREAAQLHTQLVLHDMIMQHACIDDDADDIPVRGGLPPPPSPLLANWGRANSYTYTMDMQMMTAFHSKERTLAEWRVLLAQSGWKPVQINYGSRPMVISNNTIIAVPKVREEGHKVDGSYIGFPES
ncbi:unnamed protein product [Peniophora sp. CBMAI 1063]|nr:unnamed protein product [Peniophora sp. CBMAI 1063]